MDLKYFLSNIELERKSFNAEWYMSITVKNFALFVSIEFEILKTFACFLTKMDENAAIF
jgi:intein-encoded DNA endonuclease-like protein